MLRLLAKLLPRPLKRALAERLRPYLCPPPEPPRPLAECKPGSPNVWWDELEKLRSRSLFPQISTSARHACAGIREAYGPILEQYGVTPEDFFWGSIKDEEAETLYQLVLERKPHTAYQVGTFAGYSALVVAHALRANGGGVLIAVDPEIPHRSFVNPVDVARCAAEAQGLAPYIRFVRGWHSATLGDYTGLGLKRAIPSVGVETLEAVRDQGIDFAFIDGDHSSACTLTDFLMLKDYINLHGLVVFHDVHSWPSVAQALFVLWHDIHYFVRGTGAYYGLDVHRGQDGLAALERIALETHPTLRVRIVNRAGSAVPTAHLRLPELNLDTPVDNDGAAYFLIEVPAGAQVEVNAPDYPPYTGTLPHGTRGDYTEAVITLAGGEAPAPEAPQLPPAQWPLFARMKLAAGHAPRQGAAMRVADLQIHRGGRCIIWKARIRRNSANSSPPCPWKAAKSICRRGAWCSAKPWPCPARSTSSVAPVRN